MKRLELIKINSKDEEKIINYKDKWRSIAFSTERIDRDKAASAIETAYNFINEKEPEIFFYNSPYGASIKLDIGGSELDYEDLLPGLRCGYDSFDLHLWEQVDKMRELISDDMDTKLEENEEMFFESSFEPGHLQPDYACCYFAFSDPYLTENNQENKFFNLEAWNIFREIIVNCGLIAAYQEICVICDRPTRLFFDEQNLLHAEGKPAVEYADGYKLYAHHGVAIPEKYGKIKFSEWKSEWLLTEKDHYIKKILLKMLNQ